MLGTSIDPGKMVQVFRGKSTRRILLLIALIVSVAFYTYVVDIYDPNMNFLAQVWRGIVRKSYSFYSGSEGGFYIQIGKLLSKETRTGARIVIYDKKSYGGFENAISVFNSSSAFGLLQEDTLAENDSIRQRLNFVTPLYLERMHVLYRKDKFEKKFGKKFGKDIPYLSPDSNSTRDFFKQARISTGPPGSGSKIFAGHLLSQCGYGGAKDQNLEFMEALTKLDVNGLDVVFTIAGAPLRSVKNILEKNKKVKLMSIDPILIQKLNRGCGLRLRPTTFKNIYDEGKQISTIGSFAFLIASKDVPNSAIMELLSVLDRSKHKMEGYSEEGSFPLDQFGFKEAFEKEYEGFRMELLRNLLVFLVSIVGTTVGSMVFLVWLASGYKQVKYFHEITKIYSTLLPSNTSLNEEKGLFPRPIVYDNQSEIISDLVRGIAQLLSVTQRIRQDYEMGGITIAHYRHLLDSVYEIKDIFQRNLAQRLNEALESKALEIRESKELLRGYYTSGYLRREDYRELLVVLESG